MHHPSRLIAVKGLAGIILSAFCAQFTFAQNSTTVADTLPDAHLHAVVVTAQFVPTDTRQTVNSVRIIDRRAIERRAAVNLEELLATEPNLRFSQDAILGSAVSINGLRGENLKILIDGVPVTGRLDGSIDAGQLPVNAVQQVEMIEGAQSLLYGSEAAAGVINLVTRKSQAHQLEAEVNTQWESNGFKNVQARAGVQVGKMLVQLSGTQLDFDPLPDTSLGRNQTWNPKFQRSGRAVLRFAPSERIDLRLSGGMFTETIDNLGDIRRPQYKPYAFDDYYHTDRNDLTLHGEGWLPGRWFWQATSGYNDFYRIKNSFRFDFEDEKLTPIEGEQDTSVATGWLQRATIARDRNDRRLNYLFGLENYRETAEGSRIVDSSAEKTGRAKGNDLGVFFSVKSHFFNRKLALQAGARWTNNQLYGSALTPSVWALWKPQDQWQLRVSYANGFRSPALKELYFSFIDVNHFLVGNTDLTPERSNNLRAELRRSLKINDKSSAQITASGFYNKVRDRIILSEFAPVQYRYVNLDRWETAGAGLGVRLQIADWLQIRSEWLATGYYNTYSLENDSLARLQWSPDWANEISASFLNQRLSVNIWHKMTGRTPYFFEEDGALIQGESEGWHLLNGSVGARLFDNRLRLSGGVKNLLDVRQIRTGAAERLGHADDVLRPVHWGRTWFITAAVCVYSKKQS